MKFAAVALLGSVVMANDFNVRPKNHEKMMAIQEATKSVMAKTHVKAKSVIAEKMAYMKEHGKPMPFDKHKAIFIKKYGVKKWEALCELKKMWESVKGDKETFVKKWGKEKLEAFFALEKMWKSIDGKKEHKDKHAMYKKRFAKKHPEAMVEYGTKVRDQLVNLMQW